MTKPQNTKFTKGQRVWPVDRCARCHLTHHASLDFIDSVQPFIVTGWYVSDTGYENYDVKGDGFDRWDRGTDKAKTSFGQEDLFGTKVKARAACTKRNKDIV